MKTQPEKEKEKEREERLLGKLRRHPELMECVEVIAGLAEDEGKEGLSADEIEEQLIEEVRRLGNRVMQDRVMGAEEAASERVKSSQPGVRLRKKKS